MLTTLTGYTSPAAILNVQVVYGVMLSLSYFILLWDWLSNLGNDWFLIVKSQSATHPLFSLKPWFLLSRYMTLLWCTFVVVAYAFVGRHPNVCHWFQYFPYGYTVVMLPAHLVMILRVYSIYEQKSKILMGLMGLALVDFAIQMGVNHLATSVLLQNYLDTATCFTYPTTAVFSLVFISPTVFHHCLLGMTLWKSAQYLKRSGENMSVSPILHVIQRDHLLFVLAICLINFTNLVLSLQPGNFAYKLINQLPAAAFTQIFLSKIVFSLKNSVKAAGASSSGVPSPKTSDQSRSYPRTHKPTSSQSSGATLYDVEVKTPPPSPPASGMATPRSPTRDSLPRDWPRDEDGPTPLTRVPPPLRTPPPFASLPLRYQTGHRRGSSADGVSIGRQTLVTSDDERDYHQQTTPGSFLSMTPELRDGADDAERYGLAV